MFPFTDRSSMMLLLSLDHTACGLCAIFGFPTFLADLCCGLLQLLDLFSVNEMTQNKYVSWMNNKKTNSCYTPYLLWLLMLDLLKLQGLSNITNF